MNYIQKYMAALKLNKWPMVDYVKQAEQEQQDKVNKLSLKKTEHNFSLTYADIPGGCQPPMGYGKPCRSPSARFFFGAKPPLLRIIINKPLASLARRHARGSECEARAGVSH